jgi:UDP-2-acetamido-3-amino-2,3-dideoxy-glucuronate N-acetyltransferase
MVVGGGRWGKNLIRNFHELECLHTICDSNPSALQQYAQLYPDVRLASDYSNALQDPSIDKVVIAAPAALHYSMALQALHAGKDLFVEKPLCLQLAEGQELLQTAARLNRVLLVGHLLQYHPHIIQLQQLVKDGALGQLLYLSSTRFNLGAVRQEENALWSLAPHDLSLILSFAQEKPESLRCEGRAWLNPSVADRASITLHFPSGLHAQIFVSWLHPVKEHKLIAVGSTGMAVFDDTKEWHEKLTLYRNAIQWQEGRFTALHRQPGELLKIEPGEPLKNECVHFLESCRERTTPKTDAAEGVQVLGLLHAAEKSMSQHGELVRLTEPSAYFAHSTAEIDPTATILNGTKIWHYSRVMERAAVGCNCNIGQNVVISPDVLLGNNVKVQNNVSLYTGVVCEDDVFLGPSMVFTNVLNPRSQICRRSSYQKTLVKRGATIGANATIVCGLELGEYCFVGAGAVVTKNVKPFALMVGNPAKQIGWMSRAGERLDLPLASQEGHVQRAACKATGELYLLNGNALYQPLVEISRLIGADRDADFEQETISEDKCSKDAREMRQGNGKFQLEAGIISEEGS